MQGHNQRITSVSVTEDQLDEACYVFAKYYRAVAGNVGDLRGQNRPNPADINREFQRELLTRARFELGPSVTEADCAFVRHGDKPKANDFIAREGARTFLMRVFQRRAVQGIVERDLHRTIDEFISAIHAEARVMKNRFA